MELTFVGPNVQDRVDVVPVEQLTNVERRCPLLQPPGGSQRYACVIENSLKGANDLVQFSPNLHILKVR
jgi:hypothetical protein